MTVCSHKNQSGSPLTGLELLAALTHNTAAVLSPTCPHTCPGSCFQERLPPELMYDWSSHSTAGEWPLSPQPSLCTSNPRLRPRKVKSWLATGHSLWVPADPLGPSLPTVEHGMLHQLEEAEPKQENDLEGGAGLAAGSGTPASTTITTTFCSNCNLAPCTTPDTPLCQRCFRSQT